VSFNLREFNRSYEKIWSENPALNKMELRKFENDGLKIFADIPRYTKNLF
jgi:hypothetical protein